MEQPARMLSDSNVCDSSDDVDDEAAGETSEDAISVPGNDDRELLAHWAAAEIQCQWRKYCSLKEPPPKSRDLHTRSEGELCCACFASIGTHSVVRPEEIAETSVPRFCTPCKSTLQRGLPTSVTSGTSSPVSSLLSSPLPKLSLLVQMEARYQEQLRVLRQQQELLRQQQNEIGKRKKVQAETSAIEKQIAKLRRKEFQRLMARRQAEETRRLEDFAAVRDQSTSHATKQRLKTITSARSRSVTPAETTSLMDPVQLRRHRIPALERALENEHAAGSKAAALAERVAQEHRRKQKIETLKCYAQDLTPLIHGNKPKKLSLPTAQAHATTTATNKRLKKPPQKPLKQKPRKIIQLAPLQSHTKNNQSGGSEPSLPLRVAIPRQSFETYYDLDSAASNTAAPTPLTAEIKPIAWMYEIISTDPILAKSHSKTQLTTLYGVDDRDDGGAPSTPTTQLPPTGQRVPLVPLGALSSPPPPPPVDPPASYSSERLASLLRKYSVSVPQTHTAAQ